MLKIAALAFEYGVLRAQYGIIQVRLFINSAQTVWYS